MRAGPGPRRSTGRRILLAVGAVLALLVAAVVALAVVPVGSVDLSPRPDPAPDHAAAKARFDAIAAEEERIGVYGECRSRLLDHGRQTDVSVVLVHGLTNCPKQWLEFAETVHAQGANVLILRVPHHGLASADGAAIGDVSNLAALTPQELRAYGDTAADLAAGLGQQPRVMGLSMGGVVTAWIAQNRPEMERTVVIAPALTLPVGPPWVTTGFINLFGHLPSITLPGSDKASITHAYNGETTRGLVAMYRLGADVRAQSAATPPAVRLLAIDWNLNDNQIDNGQAQALARDWANNGADVAVHVFAQELGLPHDVIDPAQAEGDTAVVYPVLLEQLGFSS
ncbi:MAG: alpha/beta hydrolase [Gaiellales bacterium]